MYSEQDLLTYIKEMFGYPYNPIELNDTLLTDIIKRTVRDFSKYFPHRENIVLNPQVNGVPGNLRNYIIQGPNPSMELLTVTQIIGYPFAVNDIYREISIGMYDNDMVNSINKYIVTFQLGSNGEITLLNNYSMSTNFIAKCTFTHSLDLSTIKNKHQEALEAIACSYTAKRLLAIRSMYETVGTGLGDVNLNLQYLNDLIEAGNQQIEELKKAAVLAKYQPVLVS